MVKEKLYIKTASEEGYHYGVQYKGWEQRCSEGCDRREQCEVKEKLYIKTASEGGYANMKCGKRNGQCCRCGC